MSKIALIDMDGTIADFDKAMSAKLEQLRLPLGYSPEFKEICSLIKESPGFWRNLEKIEAGFHVLDIMRDIGFSLNILTKGPERSTNAWTAKVEWCQEHVPDAPITISQDKSIVYGFGTI